MQRCLADAGTGWLLLALLLRERHIHCRHGAACGLRCIGNSLGLCFFFCAEWRQVWLYFCSDLSVSWLSLRSVCGGACPCKSRYFCRSVRLHDIETFSHLLARVPWRRATLCPLDEQQGVAFCETRGRFTQQLSVAERQNAHSVQNVFFLLSVMR